MDNKKYVDYILEQAENLINIDSPSGYGEGVTQYLLDEFGKMAVCLDLMDHGSQGIAVPLQ